MAHFPFKGIGIGCTILTFLVIVRCIVTIAWNRYYGYVNWSSLVLQDPWFYVGMLAAALGIACFVTTMIQEKKHSRR